MQIGKAQIKDCLSVSKVLDLLSRYWGFEEKNVLIKSFIYGNFNYCPLSSHFYSKNSLNKIKKIQKRALGFPLNYYETKVYWNTLSNTKITA